MYKLLITRVMHSLWITGGCGEFVDNLECEQWRSGRGGLTMLVSAYYKRGMDHEQGDGWRVQAVA